MSMEPLADLVKVLMAIVLTRVLGLWWQNRENESFTLLAAAGSMYRHDVSLLERTQTTGPPLRCPAVGREAPVFPQIRKTTYSSCYDCEPVEVARIRVSCDDGALTYTFLDAPARFRRETLVFRLPPDGATGRKPDCIGGTLGWPNRPRYCE